jgi:hypothetical protein
MPGLYGYNFNGWNGGWFYNPFFGMYTFVPGGDMFLNAFGYGFFSPYTIYSYYTPTTYWYGGGGARGTGFIGRPITGTSNPTISTLRGGGSANTGGLPALGSPARTGGVVNSGSGNRGMSNTGFARASDGNFGPVSSGAAAASSASMGAGTSSAGAFSSRGGGFSGGGAPSAPVHASSGGAHR